MVKNKKQSQTVSLVQGIDAGDDTSGFTPSDEIEIPTTSDFDKAQRTKIPIHILALMGFVGLFGCALGVSLWYANSNSFATNPSSLLLKPTLDGSSLKPITSKTDNSVPLKTIDPWDTQFNTKKPMGSKPLGSKEENSVSVEKIVSTAKETNNKTNQSMTVLELYINQLEQVADDFKKERDLFKSEVKNLKANSKNLENIIILLSDTLQNLQTPLPSKMNSNFITPISSDLPQSLQKGPVYPILREKLIVKGVVGNSAWIGIKGKKDNFQRIKIGSKIKNYGAVISIDLNDQNQWVVRTEGGIIK